MLWINICCEIAAGGEARLILRWFKTLPLPLTLYLPSLWETGLVHLGAASLCRLTGRSKSMNVRLSGCNNPYICRRTRPHRSKRKSRARNLRVPTVGVCFPPTRFRPPICRKSASFCAYRRQRQTLRRRRRARVCLGCFRFGNAGRAIRLCLIWNGFPARRCGRRRWL